MEKADREKYNAQLKRGEVLSSWRSLLFSFLVHLLVFASSFLIIELFRSETLPQGRYVTVSVVKGAPMDLPETGQQQEEEKPAPEKPAPEKPDPVKPEDKEPAVDPEENSINKKERKTQRASGFSSIETAGFDSTSLNQIYSEATLNVRVKYPAGWVYVDQQQKKKLDGITFWSSDGRYAPPPYVHVEVVEKYMFNPSQYKFRYDFPNFTGYYNDPTELEGQVSQSIYIRTGDEEDYIIKLIMNGKEQFKEFQPTFFAMVKSFKFGRSFF